MRNKKSKKIVSWILRLLAALIMLQTLFFKFTGAEESIYIFTQVGMEPWGRYMTGVVELIASVLLLTNRYEWGALLGLGTISGAILFHLTKLGIEVQGDGGYLFALAIVVFVSCMTTLLINFSEIKTKYLPNK
ncbi:DoxX family protein [uncultured Roseivirga sp.]|uniref:DoxX family protein n=1 Tax=uncultured Roseivirga sp. TaxID=543088 RepID=UPI0030DD9F94